MKKTHLLIKAGKDIACHRVVKAGVWTTEDTSRVTCQTCRYSDDFDLAHEAILKAQEEAFNAQTPKTVVPQFGRVNADGVMECPKDGGILWREKPRSLFSYHYVCESCGFSVHPMTETGMCT